MPEGAPPMIGQVLDRYRIESQLGEGGMGVVYKARDTQLDRPVAIKVLSADKVSDRERRQRFVQEAKAASALNHPGIVTVHDIRSAAGIDFIVMEYLAGKTLDAVIPPKGLGLKEALRYGVEIADALAKAHDAGIIHRDLKPSNLMVCDEGHVKILDFGLAKLLDPAEVSAETLTRTASLTEEGVVLGTVVYMSPEQAEGRRLDARSDIFSFGAVLYEMVTGRRPFTGNSRLSVQAKILSEDPAPPSRLSPSVPPEVDRTILRCLRKDPARRYQTMADLKVALEDLSADSTSGLQTASRVARAPRRWVWAWAALLPVLVTAGYFGWHARRSNETTTPLHAVPLVSVPGVTRSPSFSPDGNQVAFNWTGRNGNNPDIYITQIGVGTPLQLTTDPANDYSPMWSPDGRWIAFLRGDGEGRRPHDVRLVPAFTGSERKLTEIRPRGFLRPLTLDWCPDSTCVVVIDSLGVGKPDALFVVSLESGEKRQLTHPEDSVYADNDPAISPDGKWLVFRRDFAPFTGGVYALPLRADLTAAGDPRRLTPTSLYAYNPRWMPDSAEIVFSAKGALWRTHVAGEPRLERLPFVGEDGVTPIVSRPQRDRVARLAYVRSYTDSNIWRVTVSAPGAPASSPPAAAISSTRRDAIPDITPDGRQVAFTSTRSGESEIWRSDASGAGAVQLTSLRTVPGFPRWSPDGERIAFHTNGVEGNGDIFVISAQGGRPTNLTSHAAIDAFPSFSHDGQWIYFTSYRAAGRPSIWKIAVSGGLPVQVSTGVGMMPLESPNGAYLYYVESANLSSPGTLWRAPVGGGAAEKIVDGVGPSTFDVLDGGIYYIERIAGQSRLQYFDLATRRVITVAVDLGLMDGGLSASGDGRTILFSRVDSSVNDLMLVENFR